MNTSFERKAASDEWYTPKELVDSLGKFDLDPCAPVKRLWDTAKKTLYKRRRWVIERLGRKTGVAKPSVFQTSY